MKNLFWCCLAFSTWSVFAQDSDRAGPPRNPDHPGPSPDELAEIQKRAQELHREGKHEEADELVRKFRQGMQRREQERRGGPPRGGEALRGEPRGAQEALAEEMERMERQMHALREAAEICAEAGLEEPARDLAEESHRVGRRLEEMARHRERAAHGDEGRDPRAEGGDREQLLDAIEGLRDEVRELREMVEEVMEDDHEEDDDEAEEDDDHEKD